MNKYKLYINGNEIDLNGDETILITKQRTDYTNPTIIKNSFTKTIKIPGTKANNKIFNEIWKLDRVQWGDFFNASKRTPFILFKNGTLIETGYVKLNNIVWNTKTKTYEYDITLFGEIGSIIYKLSYKEENDELRPLTLADLDFGFNRFQISRSLIIQAWNYLKTGVGDERFKAINFCVSYDGIPTAANFDTKKVWCSVRRDTGDVYWEGGVYGHNRPNTFPVEYTNEGIQYKTINTMISRMDPDDEYGLLEFKNDLTPLEVRDLRSYLLRPIVSISAIFGAISKYLEETEGYTLDMNDPLFSSDEFKDTWMTLPMLYEVDEDVQSFSYISKDKLFQGTSSPANYLISYCKIYGIYIDVDVIEKKILLRRIPNFFKDETRQLIVDKGKEIKIDPLSFDKATYTFDYAVGDGEFLKKYNDLYGVKYGSKRVNTGYAFSADEAPYINNNIFKSAVDALEQSIFYCYPVEGGLYANPYYYPIGVYDKANLPEYKLFDSDYNSYGGEMSDSNTGTSRLMQGSYELLDSKWAGLKAGRYQDAFPKVQLHGDDNKGIDGKGVLVKFNGFKKAYRGYEDGTNFYKYSTDPVQYLLSDDWLMLKQYTGGKNCYYDNPEPGYGYGGGYLDVIDEIPSFTVCKYNYEPNQIKYPVMYSDFTNVNLYGGSNVSVTPGRNVFITNITASSGRRYPYTRIDGMLKGGHRYLLMSIVETSDATAIKSGNDYDVPHITNATVINKKGLEYTTSRQMLLSLVDLPATITTSMVFSPLNTNNLSSTISFYTYQMCIYDLTAMGIGDMTNATDVAEYLGLSADNNNGYSYEIDSTFNFGETRELYVPATSYNPNATIYDRYWSRYISDVYSINTKVIECYCFLDNSSDTFRRFYYYDNSLWILSKMVDWVSSDKLCKATFIKVNDKDDYLQLF